MNAWWLVALLIPTSVLAVRAAFYYLGRALYHRGGKEAMTDECVRVAISARQSEDARQQLVTENKLLRDQLEQLSVPSDEQLNAWMEAAR